MERVYAFTDEYGQFGWDLKKQGVSSCFIISSIIVKESELALFEREIEIIKKKFFQTGEMKSSSVGKNFSRRTKILLALDELPFKIFSVVIDKQKCLDNMSINGLKYKKTFYKFMNNIVHKELRQSFDKITIIADEIGSTDYMTSFCRYVESKQDIANLLGEADFLFQNSMRDVRIQVADFISGTLARIYDKNMQDGHGSDYYSILTDKIIRIEEYPKTYHNFSIENSAISAEYDSEIANLCYSRAVTYIHDKEQHETEDDYEKARLIVLKYLLFRFMNNDERRYISTRELASQLEHTRLRNISDQAFRSNIIGKLRDAKVIIASSTKGYKIPASLMEIKDYVLHDARVVMPMLSRLNNCRNLVKMNTLNEVDLLDGTGFEDLKGYFDNYNIEEN